MGADNKSIKNLPSEPSKNQQEPIPDTPKPGNGDNRNEDITNFFYTLYEKAKKYRPLIMLPVALSGLVTFYVWSRLWFIGLLRLAWNWLIWSFIVLLVFLGVLARALWKRREELKPFEWRVVLIIAIPFLVCGVLLAAYAQSLQTDKHVLILVEPFVGTGEKPYYIEKIIKTGLEEAIPREDRYCVKVILGEGQGDDKTKNDDLYTLAMRDLANMVISGWYRETDRKTLVCVNFRVISAPKSFPAVFRGRVYENSKVIVFGKKEIESASIYLQVSNLVGYECTLLLGAGAYASGNWEMAERYFEKALKLNEKSLQDSEFKDEELKKQLGVHRAFLYLYNGYSLANQNKLPEAIAQFSGAIKLCMENVNISSEYHEMLARAYTGRGITYRKKNMFEMAKVDFQKVGRYPLRSDGLKLHEGSNFPENMVELNNLAEKYFEDGDNYLKDDTLIPAQAELEISVELFSRLSKKALLTTQKQQYDYGLAKSLVRLGEAHNRQALHEFRNDEHTGQAVKYLNDALKVIEYLEEQGSSGQTSLLVLKADCLRHLGDAHRKMDMIKKVEKAIRYHTDANKLWEGELRNHKEAGKEAGGELTRIGDTYRRLYDLKYDPNEKNLNEIIKFCNDKAICFYKKAIEKRGGETYLNVLYSDQPDQQAKLAREEKELIEESIRTINAHHLASSLGNLAETLINREEPNDLKTAITLLQCAGECFRQAQEKLDKGYPNWTKKLEEERNQTLRDDLAWCLTFHGYALVRQGPPEDADKSIKTKYYEHAKEILDEAEKNRKKLPSDKVDEASLVLNRFALVVPLFELNQNQNAQKTFYDACLRLRRMTRERRKIWHTDYVCNIIEVLKEAEFKIGKEKIIDQDTYNHLNAWLASTYVKAGRQTLEGIIGKVEEELKKPQDIDY